jgi:hypothetical protein
MNWRSSDALGVAEDVRRMSDSTILRMVCYSTSVRVNQTILNSLGFVEPLRFYGIHVDACPDYAAPQ